MKRRRNFTTKPVPARIRKTPRSAGEGLYVYPKTLRYPIGDLYHARTALVYILSPNNAKSRKTVAKAVQKAYPTYNWGAWWNKEKKRGVPAWSTLVGAKKNPRLSFSDLQIGDSFESNGSTWVKKSSRTAYIFGMPHRWFYFSKSDPIFSTRKEANEYERSQPTIYLNPRRRNLVSSHRKAHSYSLKGYFPSKKLLLQAEDILDNIAFGNHNWSEHRSSGNFEYSFSPAKVKRAEKVIAQFGGEIVSKVAYDDSGNEVIPPDRRNPRRRNSGIINLYYPLPIFRIGSELMDKGEGLVSQKTGFVQVGNYEDSYTGGSEMDYLYDLVRKSREKGGNMEQAFLAVENDPHSIYIYKGDKPEKELSIWQRAKISYAIAYMYKDRYASQFQPKKSNPRRQKNSMISCKLTERQQEILSGSLPMTYLDKINLNASKFDLEEMRNFRYATQERISDIEQFRKMGSYFGKQPPSMSELREVEGLLAKIEKCLNGKSNPRRRKNGDHERPKSKILHRKKGYVLYANGELWTTGKYGFRAGYVRGKDRGAFESAIENFEEELRIMGGEFNNNPRRRGRR